MIDKWRNAYKAWDKIVSKLNTLCNDKQIIYLTHGSDPVVSALQKDDNRKEVSMLYLKVLSRKDLRVFVNNMDRVFNLVGIDEVFHPFKDIKWRLNESKAGITQEKLEQQVKDSRMPDDIKVAVADSDFDSVKLIILE